MSRGKSLVKNTVILTIGNLGTKCVSFFLVPLYTVKLTTEDYGFVDLLNTFITLLLPIVSFQVSNALFRFSIDIKSEEDEKNLYSNTLFIILVNSILFLLIYRFINQFINIRYAEYLAFATITNILSEVHLQFVRGKGKMGVYSLTSFLIGLINVGCNLFLIFIKDYGGLSILIASVSANFMGTLFIFAYLRCYKLISLSSINKKIIKTLLQYSLPLIPNSLSWWVTNTADRLIAVFFLGASANGILAIAHKIPNIYIMLFNIFNISWVESLSRAILDIDADVYISSIFERVFKLLSCCIIGLIAFIPLIFDVYVGKSYYGSYNLILIFCIAMFINSLCSMYGGIFTAHKKSTIIGKTTVIGAIVNIIVHISLVKLIGLYAAALSILISYIVILVIRMKLVRELSDVKLPIKFIIRFGIILLTVSITYILDNMIVNIVVFICVGIWTVIENRTMFELFLTAINKR